MTSYLDSKSYCSPYINTLRPRQNGRHFADAIFKCIFLNENVWIPIKISWKFVPKGPINNIPALVQIMAWHRPGEKPLSESMMVGLPMHICVTRPQWVKTFSSCWHWYISTVFNHCKCIIHYIIPSTEMHFIKYSLLNCTFLHILWLHFPLKHFIYPFYMCSVILLTLEL